jgi:hypothetical protein
MLYPIFGKRSQDRMGRVERIEIKGPMVTYGIHCPGISGNKRRRSFRMGKWTNRYRRLYVKDTGRIDAATDLISDLQAMLLGKVLLPEKRVTMRRQRKLNVHNGSQGAACPLQACLSSADYPHLLEMSPR